MVDHDQAAGQSSSIAVLAINGWPRIHLLACHYVCLTTAHDSFVAYQATLGASTASIVATVKLAVVSYADDGKVRLLKRLEHKLVHADEKHA
jgi:hypothetical protein